MTSHILTRFRIRRRPYVAKATCGHWLPGYQWGPVCYECATPRPVPGGNGGVDKDTTSKVYKIVVGVYKSWLENILGVNVAFYLMTGALVSLYLARGLSSFTGFFLVVPVAVGIGAVSYVNRCLTAIKDAKTDVEELKRRLDAKMVPDMGYVEQLLEWSRRLFWIAVIVLSVLVLVCFIQTGLLRWIIDGFTHRAA